MITQTLVISLKHLLIQTSKVENISWNGPFKKNQQTQATNTHTCLKPQNNKEIKNYVHTKYVLKHSDPLPHVTETLGWGNDMISLRGTGKLQPWLFSVIW